MVDRLYSYGETKLKNSETGAKFFILSRRAAFFAVRQTLKGKWLYPAFEFKKHIVIGDGLCVIGCSIHTGNLITIKMKPFKTPY